MADFDPDAYLASKEKKNPFDTALAAEGVSGQVADIARSIYQQESGSGKNTKTSNAGAVGGMQIIPTTFNRMADKGWAIDNPDHNARAGIRYIKMLYDKADGDPALTAAGYYGGEGAIGKAKQGIAVSDPRNPNAPNTLQYGQQVAARLPTQPTQALQAPQAPAFDPDAYLSAIPQKPANPAEQGYIESAAAGLGSGVGRVAMGAQHYLGKGLGAMGADTAGKWLVDDAAQGRAKLAGEVAPYKAANPFTTGAGEFAGEIAATLPAGGLIGAGAKAVGATRLGTAIGTGGMSTGATTAGGWAKAGDVGIRMAGGSINGGVSAGLVDPNSAGTGAVIGALLPGIGQAVGMGANTLGATVRPFFAKGQERIAGNTLREFSENPTNALAQLSRSGEVVQGSMPTTAMAAGDNGLASLSRAMQNADPRFAAELATRQTAQNQARTTALENIAGNTGKIDIAKSARDAVTTPMRESVLEAAGKVPIDKSISQIDRLIADPNNAGKLSQQVLNEYRNSIAKASQDGHIDARALYEIRKDINLALQGKLQGEAGNLRYAAGQLNSVKGVIDDAIDMASKATKGTGTELMPAGANISTHTMPNPVGSQAPRASWSDYLQKYTKESIPINQMEKLDAVLKAAQTGTVDSQGGLILSGAKLNNILKNDGDALKKALSTDQLDILRRVSADLNAGQIANNTGRAVGSNTLQNMAQNQILTSALGKTIGGSSPATATLGRLLQLPYGTANKQIQERLGNALLDPKEAARLMADPKTNKLLQMLSAPQQLGYRAAPLIYAQ